ncbi:MAG: DMT family transporter [Eubacteriales bacterium]|nr:DMT family transporter [Eubacteriales bacterium]
MLSKQGNGNAEALSGDAGHSSRDFLSTKPGLVLGALLATFLWGSATPFVKEGYRLFQVDGSSIPTILVFAGLRFILAGVMVLGIAVALGVDIRVKRSSYPKILKLAASQTFIQYSMEYIGLSMISGVMGSLLCGAQTVFSLLLAHFIFHQEDMTARKALGCLIGALGLAIGMGNPGSSSPLGILFMLIGIMGPSVSGCLMHKYGQSDNPMVLSGWQFLTGGIGILATGFLFGGRLTAWNFRGIAVLVYLAFVSACAYTVWSFLMKKHEVSQVSMFNLANPIVSVLLSALILGEGAEAFSGAMLAALLLVSVGIYIVTKGSEPVPVRAQAHRAPRRAKSSGSVLQ